MQDAGRSSRTREVVREIGRTWRLLSPEQRVAGVAATLLVISTFGPFSFVEAAIVLVGVAVLALLRARAEGRRFHLPFGDGTVIATAGAWCAFLIVVRVLDRPLGQNLLALGCALLLFLAGARERAKRPPDDLPQPGEPREPRADRRRPSAPPASERPTQASAGAGDPPTARLGSGGPTREERATRPLEAPDTRPVPEDPPEMTARDEQDGDATARAPDPRDADR